MRMAAVRVIVCRVRQRRSARAKSRPRGAAATSPSVPAHLPLEREIFAPPPEVERADRCVWVGSLEDDARDDADACAEGDGVGGCPSRGETGAEDLRLRPDERDVERIGRDPGGVHRRLRRPSMTG